MEDLRRLISDGFGNMLSLAIRLATALGALVTLALALIGTTDVLTTTILARPIPGLIELSEAGLILIFFLGLTAGTRSRGQIRVDVIVNRMGQRGQRIFSLVGYLITAIFFSHWTLQMWHLAAKSMSIQEVATGLLPFPLYPVKIIAFLGLLIATIETVRRLVRSILDVFNPNSPIRKG
ncbi:MAG: TRAP transporter small permease [Desulfobacterales bacterium]|nr:TRAP transporter small permease [Desulfobacterales bacterium]